MADIRIPDVRDIYFLHKMLTRIVWQPHYGSLWVLSMELKSNASSDPSTEWWYVQSPLPPPHFTTICNIVRGRVHIPKQPMSVYSPQKWCGRRLITCSICAKLLKEHLSPKW